MDGLYWKILLKWMIWGYGVPLYLETPISIITKRSETNPVRDEL